MNFAMIAALSSGMPSTSLALELLRDGFLELGNAVDIRVARFIGLQRFDRRLFDVLGRVEVRLACGERDDVPALSCELTRLGRHRNGLRGGDAVHAVGKKAHRVASSAVCVAGVLFAPGIRVSPGDRARCAQTGANLRLSPPESRPNAG